MKTRFFLLCAAFAMFLIAGCSNPALQEENDTTEENTTSKEEQVTPETDNGDDGTFSVTFSLGSEQSDNQINASTIQKSSVNVPVKYDQIDYFMLTIRDSEGKVVINRQKYEKISWAPGYVVSTPLKLAPGSYTLEELILVRSDNLVLYATPRTGSFLDSAVKKSLPIQFDLTDADLTVFSQVIDVQYDTGAINDPVGFFGYALGVIDEIAPYYLDIKIYDIDGTDVTEDITITDGDWTTTKTINAGGSRIYIPNNLDSYTVNITAADGSGYTGDGSSHYYRYADQTPDYYGNYNDSIKDFISYGRREMRLHLSSPVSTQFVVKDENGNNLDGSLRFAPYLSRGSHYDFNKENDLYTETIYASRSTEIIFTATGYDTFTQVYTLDELKNSETTPIEIRPAPTSVTFPVTLNKPQDLIDATADITIVSTGKTTVISNVPYDTLTSLTFSRASNPVEITISGENIIPIQNTYTVNELESYTDSNPLYIDPAATLTLPVMLNQPAHITAAEADIQIVSNGFTYNFPATPYGTLREFSISNLTNPVEITVSGTNIETTTNSYTIAQLFSYTGTAPLQVSPHNSFQVPIRCIKPSGLPHSSATITVVSNGKTQNFDNLSYTTSGYYGTTTNLTITDVTNPVEFTVSGENINQLQKSYTIYQITNYYSDSSPIYFFPSSTASFSVMISKPELVTADAVDIQVISNGTTTDFTDVPFGTLTPLSFSGVSDSVRITVSGENIATIQNNYTLSQINSYTDSNPLRLDPINTFQVPILINRPVGVPHANATVSVTSGGQTQDLTIPYNTVTPLVLSDVDERVGLYIWGDNINEIVGESYTLDQLAAFTDSNPLEYSPTNNFEFDLYISTPSGFPHSQATVEITSNGTTTVVNVPYRQATNLTFSDINTDIQVTISGDNIVTLTESYSIAAMLEIAENGGQENVYPVTTFTVPVLLDKAAGINDTAATVSAYSDNYLNTLFSSQDIPYGTLTQFTILGATTGSVKITVTGSGIGYLSNTYTLSQLMSYTDSTPLQLTTSSQPVTLLSDTFESGLGNWTQDSSDGFNWTRQSGSTSSSSTGPTSAYTGIYYMYTEASSNFNNTAALISPLINFDAQSGEYITMKLHMYGSSMGTITVYYQNDGSSTWTQVGSRSGNQGNSWQDFKLSLDHITGNARLKISGTTGSDYMSDICIDDVVIKN